MKTLFFPLLLILISTTVYSQSLTLDITAGYCIPIASSFRSISAKEVQISTPPNFYADYQSLKSTSYGQGGSVALNLNWFSKKNIGFGLRLNALLSSPFSNTVLVTYLNSTSATYYFTDKPFSFQFVPHFSAKHDFKIVSPVLEMGMLIGITQVKEQYQATYNNGDILQSSINNHGGALLGFYSSLGLSFHVSRMVNILVAVNCNVGSYSPTEWDRTSFVVNGTDQLSTLSPSQVHGVYVKELNPTVPQSSALPHQDLKYSIPFSNVGFSAGIALNFAKRTDKIKDKENTKVQRSF